MTNIRETDEAAGRKRSEPVGREAHSTAFGKANKSSNVQVSCHTLLPSRLVALCRPPTVRSSAAGIRVPGTPAEICSGPILEEAIEWEK
jgi:hypothetical protein